MNRSAVKPFQILEKRFFLLAAFTLSLAIMTACTDDEQVVELVNGTPEASFEVSVDPANPDMITYTSTSTNAFSYIWTLGDSTFGFTSEITHTYDSSAVYMVSLEIANRGGEASSVSTQEVDRKSVV